MSRQQGKALLTIYDVSGIQEYIFASSRLRENTGASRIVGRILKQHLPEAIHALPGGGVIRTTTDPECLFRMSGEPDVRVEVVYNGGGSAVVAFRDRADYEAVNASLARRLIEATGTLTVATAWINTDLTSYSRDWSDLTAQLEAVKARMARPRPAAVFPVSEQEGLTGLPVTFRHERSRDNLSAVQALKREAAIEDSSDDPFLLPGALSRTHDYAVEMEDLAARKGEDGYVAVVHIDGNGMGEQFERILRETETEDYPAAVKQVRKLSRTIADGYREVFEDLIKTIAADSDSYSFFFQKRGNTKLLPIRPLIMDGDDVTFICTGRLGVPLAAAFLRRLERRQTDGLSLSACAGVALVHSHFPFNIAYEIAEQCCAAAKKRRHQQGMTQGGYLDFHLVRGSYVEGMKEQRKASGAELRRRPYLVLPEPDRTPADSFDQFHRRVCRVRLTDEEADGGWPRSRLKKLYEALQSGGEAVRALLEQSRSRGYDLTDLVSETEDLPEEHRAALLFDALELMDLYEPALFPEETPVLREEAAR